MNEFDINKTIIAAMFVIKDIDDDRIKREESFWRGLHEKLEKQRAFVAKIPLIGKWLMSASISEENLSFSCRHNLLQIRASYGIQRDKAVTIAIYAKALKSMGKQTVSLRPKDFDPLRYVWNEFDRSCAWEKHSNMLEEIVFEKTKKVDQKACVKSKET